MPRAPKKAKSKGAKAPLAPEPSNGAPLEAAPVAVAVAERSATEEPQPVPPPAEAAPAPRNEQPP
ncbi:MAG TPA: hypothetical protein VHI52_01600, partial [Verrucomicrobiae bacterium]|nr:hypothetical protein [Verrucomicrobiae bacterium]